MAAVDAAKITRDDGQSSRGNGTQAAPRDRRDLIPKLGLREYWYPALPQKQVGRKKPVRMKLLGEEITFFRGKDGQVKAIWDVCPHRGGSLAHGDCHFPGTISCPYHGWTFDETGECVAVLAEGPDSRIPGKVRARVYPTQTLRNVVFIWIGEREPAPIEEDVPAEFFDSQMLVFAWWRSWPVNWMVSLENSVDAHPPYVHRNAVTVLAGYMSTPLRMGGPIGGRPFFVENKRGEPVAVGVDRSIQQQGVAKKPALEHYPALQGRWPKSNWRGVWNWLVRWSWKRARSRRGITDNPEWKTYLHHLPGMFRAFHPHILTRWPVAKTAEESHMVYFHSVRPARPRWLSIIYEYIHFHLIHKLVIGNFSQMDAAVMVPQRYDTPENLSPTDSEIIALRKLVTQHARGVAKQSPEALEDTHAERFAKERERELGVESGLVEPPATSA
jgi:nitrite reductase/ring-hydroxylating ferredoxin subunit